MDADRIADDGPPPLDPTEHLLRGASRRAVEARDGNEWRTIQGHLADYLEEHYRVAEADAVRLERQPGCRWPNADDLPGLSDHQRQALRAGLRAPVVVLCGQPGVGKSWVLARIIKAICDAGQHSIAVAAPTGKAAVRINELMAKAFGDQPHPRPTTIHQLLEIGRNGHDNQGWGFRRNADRPLPFDVVVLEEMSMGCTDLTASVMSALRPGTHLLLVGDPHQLPPVGHGFPLRDLIASGAVPVAELTEIRRNAGAIVHQCATIREGRYREFTALPYRPYPSHFLPDDNLQIYPTRDPADQQAAVVEMVRTYLVQVDGMPDLNGVQVLCATNKGSPISRHELNLALQAVCNPHGDSAGDSPFRLGDKVICTRNGWYMPAWDADDDEEVYVANGEIGRVVELRTGWAVVEFGPGANDGSDTNDGKQARFRVGGRATNDDADSGESVGETDEGGEGNRLQLAYAITGHKGQGSQWPVVIVLLDGGIGAARICDRHWLYTAISRAEQLCVLVGDIRVARQMAMRDVASKRLTFLAEELRNGV